MMAPSGHTVWSTQEVPPAVLDCFWHAARGSRDQPMMQAGTLWNRVRLPIYSRDRLERSLVPSEPSDSQRGVGDLLEHSQLPQSRPGICQSAEHSIDNPRDSERDHVFATGRVTPVVGVACCEYVRKATLRPGLQVRISSQEAPARRVIGTGANIVEPRGVEPHTVKTKVTVRLARQRSGRPG